jgi:riboflavin kinase / FMN adenylyltransferase
VKVLDGPWVSWPPPSGPTALTVGVFDGVHIGHRLILDRLRSSPYSTTVLTFDPHPAEVLSPGTNPRLITTIDERLVLLADEGVTTVGILDLAEIRHLDPSRFVAEVLMGRLGVGSLMVGTDFHFGKDRAGDVAYLREAGGLHGFDVEVVDLLASDGIVSATRIRTQIEAGDVSSASALLGSRYRLSNTVIGGEKRGRALGFPTANLRPPRRKVIPGHGIYAAYAHVDGEAHLAAVNVGVRPTFGDSELLIEAYLLDFEDDLYGQLLTLEFVEKLRPELEFENVDALVDQIKEDVAIVRRTLALPVPVTGGEGR